MARDGLSSKEAFSRLFKAVEREIEVERNKLLKKYPPFFSLGLIGWILLTHARINSSSYCFVYTLSLVLCAALMSIDIAQNGITIKDAVPPLVMVFFVVLNIFLADLLMKRRRFETLHRAEKVLEWMRKRKQDDNLSIHYCSKDQPDSECISLQWTIRDGQDVNVPWLLLAEGDVIMIRPGHCSPCHCVSHTGQVLIAGEKVPSESTKCNETSAIIPLRPIKCTVIEPPVVEHLRDVFADHCKRRATLLDVEVRKTMHWAVEFFLLPSAALITILLLCMRQWLVTSFKESWWRVLSIFAVTLMPILGPSFPSLYVIIKYWNLSCVMGRSRFFGPRSTSPYHRTPLPMFIRQLPRPRSIRFFFKALWRFFTGLDDYLSGASDIVNSLGGLTTVAFIDKKGILSWPNATAEKIFFFHKRTSEEGETKIVPEILDLTLKTNEPFAVRFDNPNWRQYRDCLLPMAENALVNSCVFEKLHRCFLDHMTVVADSIPRTIAVASHRCLCYIVRLVGLQEAALRHFDLSTTKTLGIYQSTHGEALLPGLIKHRTPLESAFLTVTEDVNWMHHHIMGQGTADLLLNGCSYVWTGESVEPITQAARKKVVDFYQRHCVTGYCTVMTYATSVRGLSQRMSERYIDFYQYERKSEHTAPNLRRALSADAINLMKYFDVPIANTQECLDRLFRDQVLCGAVVMQYQAREDAVRLVEHLGNACVRFVYFSNENELRSRVFAEKLGLEAGWNCHISLASEGSDEWERKQLGRSMPNSEPNCSSTSDMARRSEANSRWDIHMSIKTTHRSKRSSSVAVSIPDTKTSLISDNASPSDVDDTRQSKTLTSSRRQAIVASESCMKDSPSKPSLGSWSDDVAPEVTVMPNKAQLPSGIENIRPHLENVDNVPLLVNLFTDSDHRTNREMIEIMQDHGEVVLVVGSSLNFHNGRTFSQSNCSICMEPQPPAICCYENMIIADESFEATLLASFLMSICCNFFLPSTVSIDLTTLISECRYRLRLSRSAMSFFVQSAFSLFLLQFITLFAPFPVIFTAFQMFLLACLYIPLISFTIIAAPLRLNDCINQISQKNSDCIPWKTMRRMAASICFLYVPAMSFAAIAYFIVVVNGTRSLASGSVNIVILLSFEHIVETARHIAVFFYTAFICIISASFVYIRHNVWKRCPLRNVAWMVACLVSLVIQAAYSACVLKSFGLLLEWCLSWTFVIGVVVWVIIIITVNELYKLTQINLYARDQRRRKLCFNTKLGMNSPY